MTPSILAQDPAKRAFEKFILGYSLVWMAAIFLSQKTGRFAVWRDTAHLIFGLCLALPLYLGPWLLPRIFRSLRDPRPFWDRYATRFSVFIGVLTLAQTCFGSIYFFRCMGMEYRFLVTVTVNRTPLFLYFITLAY